MIDTKEDLDNLPQGWSWAKIEEICELINGRAFKAEDWSSNGLPIIRIQNLNNHDAEFNYCNFDVEDKYIVEHGQLLFAWSGTPGTSFGAHIWKKEKGVLNQHIFKVNINENYLNKQYFKYIINYNVTQYIKKAHGTAGLAHITKNKFESSFIPFPPLSEQHRIVARIEELFSRLDAGVEALQKAKAQLKRYRQAVLKAAVEGRLTADWRKAHPEIEPAEALLERIKLNRLGFKQLIFEDDVIQEANKLSNLPKSWAWIRMGQIFGVYVGATPRRNKPEYWGGNIPWVSSGEVAFCRIYKTRETISQLGLENSSTKIHPPGTVLLGMIGEGKTRGQAAILETSACHNQNSAAIRVSEVGLPPEYVYYYFEHEYERTRKLSSGNNQPALNKNRVQSMLLPLPPLAEQQKIVEEIDRYASIIGVIKKTIEENLQRAYNFRQSILKRAFEGRLIPQDHNDEPACVLLERIRAEKANHASKKVRRIDRNTTHQMRLTQ